MSGPQLKTKNQIMAYRWTFRKDPLKLEKICEQSTIKYDMIDYDVTMDLQKSPLLNLPKVVLIC